MNRLIRNLAATGQIHSFPRRQRPLKGGYKRKSVYAGPSYATLCALAVILGVVVWWLLCALAAILGVVVWGL